MYKLLILLIAIILIASTPALAYQSLQILFSEAESQGGYDKYIELDPGIEYLGDLRIGSGLNVYLNGNGAKVYAQNNNLIHIGVTGSNLDIQNCILIGGLGGIYFVNEASGTIKNNSISGCIDTGIKIMYPNLGAGTYVYDNIVTDCCYGFYCVEGEHPAYLGYNTIYDAFRYRYAEFCPS
ncbi:MAG: right-handed parallel beta-helix repeat-containing protein [candidate division Zixibacteria bacterium]|nr:right-handed parallel beta-helix repeat-containing protein [candidate division Zixibacteria bacterium]